MFSQFEFFYGPGYGLGRGLGLPWDSQGASWGFLGPQGGHKVGFGVFGGGGARGASRLASLLALSWANRALLALFRFLCLGHLQPQHPQARQPRLRPQPR